MLSPLEMNFSELDDMHGFAVKWVDTVNGEFIFLAKKPAIPALKIKLSVKAFQAVPLNEQRGWITRSLRQALEGK